MNATKKALKALRGVPVLGWLITAVVALFLILVMVLSRLQAQRDHHRRLLEAADARRRLKRAEDKADEIRESEKEEARERYDKTEQKLEESRREIMSLHTIELSDEVNRFFESLEPKREITVEDLKP